MRPRERASVKGVIKAARARQGITQKQLCHLTAIPEASLLYRIDSGKVTLEDIRKINRVAPFNSEELDILIGGRG